MPSPVLLVADDLAVIAAVKRILGREGYETILATSAADAIIAWGHHLPGLVLLQPSVESDRGQVVVEALQQHPDARLARIVLLGETIPGFALQVEPLPLDGAHFAQTVEASLRGGAQSEGWTLAAAQAAAQGAAPSAAGLAGFRPRASVDSWRATAPPDASAGAVVAVPRPVDAPAPSAGTANLPIVDATPSLSPPAMLATTAQREVRGTEETVAPPPSIEGLRPSALSGASEPEPTAPMEAPRTPRTPPPPSAAWPAPVPAPRATPVGPLGPTRTLVTPLPAAAPLGLFDRPARVTPPAPMEYFRASASSAPSPVASPGAAPATVAPLPSTPAGSRPGEAPAEAEAEAVLERARAAADSMHSAVSEAQAQRERDVAALQAELSEALEESQRERAFRTKAELDAATLKLALESARETLRQSVVDWRTAVEATRRESEAEAAARQGELQRQLDAERASREEGQRLLTRSRDALAGALAELEAMRAEQARERSALDAARVELEATAASLETARAEADRARARLVIQAAEAAEQVALLEREHDALRAQRADESEGREALETRLPEFADRRHEPGATPGSRTEARAPAATETARAAGTNGTDEAERVKKPEKVQKAGKVEPKQEATDLPSAPANADVERLDAAYESAQTADYFGILGLPRTAGTDDVEQARARLAAEFDPARFARSPASGALERARALASLVEEAARALSDDRRRAEYARHLAQ